MSPRAMVWSGVVLLVLSLVLAVSSESAAGVVAYSWFAVTGQLLGSGLLVAGLVLRVLRPVPRRDREVRAPWYADR